MTEVVMDRLNPQELRSYAGRDWSAPERLARRDRARQSIERKVQIAIALYEAAKATRPDWPEEQIRQADLEAHLRLKAQLDQASHVGAR